MFGSGGQRIDAESRLGNALAAVKILGMRAAPGSLLSGGLTHQSDLSIVCADVF